MRVLVLGADGQLGLPMQPGDVHATWADTRSLVEAVGYQPRVASILACRALLTGIGSSIECNNLLS